MGKRSHSYDFDLFVIGSGSGGVRSSRIAASHGAKVGLAEGDRIGGTCPIRGCIPKRLFSYASGFRDELESAVLYGWEFGGVAAVPDNFAINWPSFMAKKNAEIERLSGIYRGILERAGVQIFTEFASFVDPHTLRVGDRIVTADRIMIASGSTPFVPEQIVGKELLATSNEALEWLQLPRSVALMGGGYIAVELAQIFHELGVAVTLIYRGDMLLRGFDVDVRRTVTENVVKSGVEVIFNDVLVAAERIAAGTLSVRLRSGGVREFDQVVCATGRKPNVGRLNLAAAGVQTRDGGAIVVDEWCRTSAEHIFAVGDVIDRIMLTPVALNEGHAFSDTVFGCKPRKMDYSNVPSAVFSHPPAGSVGLAEHEVAERFGADSFDVYYTKFRPLLHTITQRDVRTMMKLIVDRASNKVLGVHIVGNSAEEMIQLAGVALKCGATKAQFDATVGVHPSAAEELVTMRTARANI